MGLQIWLPLNGSIYNQGLNDVSILSRSVTYGTGKIASQGARFNGDCNQYIRIGNTEDFQYDEFTWSVWIYPTSFSVKGFIISHGRDYSKYGVNILVDTNGALNICSEKAWSGITTLILNTWYHIVVSLKKNTIKCYLNGNLVKTFTSDAQIDYGESHGLVVGKMSYSYGSTTSYFPFNGIIQDVRIYDEALSPKQVKLLSQGLVCHYPMGNIDGKIGGRNLIKNGKGNVKAGFFKNFPTVTDEYSEITLKSKKTYADIHIDGFIYRCREYTVGEKYTWSYDIMYTAWNFPTGSNRAEFWMGQRYANAPSGETSIGAWRGVTQHNLPVVGQNGCELNKWYHVEKTITIPEQASSNVGEHWFISFYNSNANVEASFTARIKNVKLEKGNIATDWTPAPEDDASFYDNVIYDTSGYCNNGSVTDSTCPTWSNDTPRYKGSYVFNGNKQVIDTPNVFHQEDITISFWFKRLKDTNTRQFLFTIWEGFSCELTADDIPLFRIATDVSHAVDALSDKKITVNDGWTHFCGVYKNGEYSKIYINGQLKKSVSSASKIYWNIHSSKIGIYNSLNTYYNGQISDVRIYATALSDSDILELYQSSASVDNNGNLMLAGEVIEE